MAALKTPVAFPKEGTTLGARYCSGRHGGLPLRLDVNNAGCKPLEPLEPLEPIEPFEPLEPLGGLKRPPTPYVRGLEETPNPLC